MLARIWPQILKHRPDAKLIVIGTGKLYNHSAKLGPWGIADSEYEQEYLMPYLGDDRGQPHSSVTFAGRLGEDKKEILHHALIGVPNQMGQTENCPGSALEFQACTTAVVSGAYWGMLDTISDKHSGLLGKTDKDLINNILKLLDSPKTAIDIGRNGVSFVSRRYKWQDVVKKWDVVFDYVHQKSLYTYYTIQKKLVSALQMDDHSQLFSSASNWEICLLAINPRDEVIYFKAFKKTLDIYAWI